MQICCWLKPTKSDKTSWENITASIIILIYLQFISPNCVMLIIIITLKRFALQNATKAAQFCGVFLNDLPRSFPVVGLIMVMVPSDVHLFEIPYFRKFESNFMFEIDYIWYKDQEVILFQGDGGQHEWQVSYVVFQYGMRFFNDSSADLTCILKRELFNVMLNNHNEFDKGFSYYHTGISFSLDKIFVNW